MNVRPFPAIIVVAALLTALLLATPSSASAQPGNSNGNGNGNAASSEPGRSVIGDTAPPPADTRANPELTPWAFSAGLHFASYSDFNAFTLDMLIGHGFSLGSFALEVGLNAEIGSTDVSGASSLLFRPTLDAQLEFMFGNGNGISLITGIELGLMVLLTGNGGSTATNIWFPVELNFGARFYLSPGMFIGTAMNVGNAFGISNSIGFGTPPDEFVFGLNVAFGLRF
ncbi:MAG: hypothetical protein AB7K09_10780 [Planctomycetota bacterium]